jgi:hypothetical protein
MIVYSFSRHNRLFFRYSTGQKELLLEYAEMLHDAVCNEEILSSFLEMYMRPLVLIEEATD